MSGATKCDRVPEEIGYRFGPRSRAGDERGGRSRPIAAPTVGALVVWDRVWGGCIALSYDASYW